jgi:hypothetical protein
VIYVTRNTVYQVDKFLQLCDHLVLAVRVIFDCRLHVPLTHGRINRRQMNTVYEYTGCFAASSYLPQKSVSRDRVTENILRETAGGGCTTASWTVFLLARLIGCTVLEVAQQAPADRCVSCEQSTLFSGPELAKKVNRQNSITYLQAADWPEPPGEC